MASETVNYKLQKPDEDDFYDIGVQNGNWDIIDQAIHENAEKIKCIQGCKIITLTAAGWNGTAAPYVQTVAVDGITVDDVPTPGIIYPAGCTRVQQKAINKAAGYIYDIETGAGTVTVRCTVKPVVDITLGLKGVV